ncbi:MAG: 6-phosphofructokinase, partial [Deltaproteobacteria bacterium]|nr:6-phosphofructokinase [Deltaproteobacteria bacterium]
MKANKKRQKALNLGVITGGGDCPGLNAAIRAVVKRAEVSGSKVFGIQEGFKGLYEGHMHALRPIDVAGIVSRGGTILGTSRFNPLKEKGGISRIRKNLAKHRIDALVNIGGEGTMRFSHELHQLGIPVVGVPKT